MPKCEACGSELKLDLYTRSYYCEKCKSIDEKTKTKIDFLIIYNELNDLNRVTYEAKFAKTLIEDLKNEYTVEVNKQIDSSKMIVVFASRTSYLYSFRKYWSEYLDKSIILVLNNIRREDLPLELRDRCIIDINNDGFIDEVKNEFKLLKEVINEHILELKENIDSSFNNETLKDAIDDEIIKNKINAGIKENPILEKTLDICDNTHIHKEEANKKIINKPLEKSNDINKQKEEINDDSYKVYDLLEEMRFDEALLLANEQLLNNPNNAKLYIYRLMATIKAKNYSVLKTYPYKQLNSFEDYNKGYSLADNDYKEFLQEIINEQAIELKYIKASKLVIDENTKIVEIKYAMSLLDEIIPYKDSSRLYNYYESELKNRVGKTVEDKIVNVTEKITKNVKPINVLLVVFAILLIFIFFSIIF